MSNKLNLIKQISEVSGDILDKKYKDIIDLLKPDVSIDSKYLTYDSLLKYVKDEDLIIKVLKNNSFALKYIENQTPEICMTAIEEIGSL